MLLLAHSRAAKKGIVRDSSATLFDGHGLVGAHGTQKVRTVTKSVAHPKSLTATLRHCFLFESMTDGELNAVVDAFKKKVRFEICGRWKRLLFALSFGSIALIGLVNH